MRAIEAWDGEASDVANLSLTSLRSPLRLAFNKEMKRRKITDKFLLSCIGGFVLLWFIFGAFWVGLNSSDGQDDMLVERYRYDENYAAVESYGTETYAEQFTCDHSGGLRTYFMYATMMLTCLGYVLILLFSVMNARIPSAFNEGKHLRQGAYTSTVLGLVYAGCIFSDMAKYQPGLLLMFFSLTSNLSMFGILSNIFAPKLWKIFKNQEVDLSDLSNAVKEGGQKGGIGASAVSTRGASVSSRATSSASSSGKFSAKGGKFESSFARKSTIDVGRKTSTASGRVSSGKFSGGGKFQSTFKKKSEVEVEMTEKKADEPKVNFDHGMDSTQEDGERDSFSDTFTVVSPLATRDKIGKAADLEVKQLKDKVSGLEAALALEKKAVASLKGKLEDQETEFALHLAKEKKRAQSKASSLATVGENRVRAVTSAPADSHWWQYEDEYGRSYFYNDQTDECTYEMPSKWY